MVDRHQLLPLLTLVRAAPATIIKWQVRMQPTIYPHLSCKKDQETRLRSPKRIFRAFPSAKRVKESTKMLRGRRLSLWSQIRRTRTAKRSKWGLQVKTPTPKRTLPIKSSSVPRSSRSKTWIIIWNVYCAWRSTIWRIKGLMWWTDAGTLIVGSASRDILMQLCWGCSTSAPAVARYKPTERKRPIFLLLISHSERKLNRESG